MGCQIWQTSRFSALPRPVLPNKFLRSLIFMCMRFTRMKQHKKVSSVAVSRPASETTPHYLYDAGFRIFRVAGKWHVAHNTILAASFASQKAAKAFAAAAYRENQIKVAANQEQPDALLEAETAEG
jgi:hypothetical protein